MKKHCGYHKEGTCWKWKFNLTRYWKKQLWWFSFWRLYFVLDFRKDWIGDMIGKAV